MNTTNIDKFDKIHKSISIKTGNCIFPFKYKRESVSKCINGKTGDWCATERSHLERNHRERNHRERNHRERSHRERNHRERNHRERNHRERNHRERNLMKNILKLLMVPVLNFG